MNQHHETTQPSLDHQDSNSWHDHFLNDLQHEFIRLKTINPQFSLRAFARRAQFSPGALSRVLAGKRQLSQTLANHILERLALPPLHQKVSPPSPPSQHLLSLDTFQLISGAINLSVLSSLSLNTEEPKTVSWIAKCLGKNERDIQSALTLLKKVQLATEDENKAWHAKEESTLTSTDVPNIAIRRFHQESLLEAEKMIFEKSLHERNLISQNLVVDEETYKEINQLAEVFRKKIIQLSKKSKKNRLMKVNIQSYFIDSYQSSFTKGDIQ
jgi:transcriptional regulator with XRE-family HTH domain